MKISVHHIKRLTLKIIEKEEKSKKALQKVNMKDVDICNNINSHKSMTLGILFTFIRFQFVIIYLNFSTQNKTCKSIS